MHSSFTYNVPSVLSRLLSFQTHTQLSHSQCPQPWSQGKSAQRAEGKPLSAQIVQRLQVRLEWSQTIFLNARA